MKDLNYYKNNCEEDYIKTPISVLRYITELEKNKMRNLLNKFTKLDNTDKFGVLFGLFVFLPLLTVLILSIITNGVKML
jgi:hypothetical protein